MGTTVMAECWDVGQFPPKSGGCIFSIQLSRLYLITSHSSVQLSRSVVFDSSTPWTAAHQASVSITNSRSLFKLMSIKSVMPSSHLLLCHPLLLLPSIFPNIRSFQMIQLFTLGGQNIGVSASTSVLPMNTQD